jgi:hypothetical protein
MSPLAATTLTVSLIVLGSTAIIVLEHRAKRRRREASRRFEHNLSNPDFEALEDHSGSSLPASLKELYSNKTLIKSTDILIGVPNPLEKEEECYVAFFEAAMADGAVSPWPGCEVLFPFANNGAGDQYLIDPRHADPEVIYHRHETGEKQAIGVTLSQFLRASRRPVPDE